VHLKIIIPRGCSILLEQGHRLFLQLLQEAAKVTCCVTVLCRYDIVSAVVTRSNPKGDKILPAPTGLGQKGVIWIYSDQKCLL